MTIAVPVSWHIGSTLPAAILAFFNRSKATKRSLAEASGSSRMARNCARWPGRSRCWQSTKACRASRVSASGATLTMRSPSNDGERDMIAGQLPVGRIVLAQRKQLVKRRLAHAGLPNGSGAQDLPLPARRQVRASPLRMTKPIRLDCALHAEDGAADVDLLALGRAGCDRVRRADRFLDGERRRRGFPSICPDPRCRPRRPRRPRNSRRATRRPASRHRATLLIASASPMQKKSIFPAASVTVAGVSRAQLHLHSVGFGPLAGAADDEHHADRSKKPRDMLDESRAAAPVRGGGPAPSINSNRAPGIRPA